MSTNTNPFEFPDQDVLEKLANQFFSALPGQDPFNTIPDLQQGMSIHQQDSPGSASSPGGQGSPGGPGSSGAQGSPGGPGSPVSPGSQGTAGSYGAAESPASFGQHSKPGQSFPGGKTIPPSVAGSGKSPSAAHLQQGSVDDIKEPPTSLPDPHFAGKGNIPSSVAGSGVSPAWAKTSPSGNYQSITANNQSPDELPAAARYQPDKRAAQQGAGNNPTGQTKDNKGTPESFMPESYHHLPFGSIQPFEAEINVLLKPISSYTPGPQLPYGQAPESGNPSFYFMPGTEGPSLPGMGTSFLQGRSGGISDMATPPFDVNRVRSDFPILQERVNGRPLIWLDNAATTQKPKQVIERLSYFYEHENSNIHRAAHELAARATDAYEAARNKVQAFLNASSPNEIVFVRGSTEAINLVAKSWGEQHLKQGDEIIISHLEHHANIVPWQQLSEKKGTVLKVIPVDEDGQIILEEYAKLLGPRTRLVSITQVSNALGTITPVKTIIEMAHQAGAKVLVDGAQAVSHIKADVCYLDCDWYVFSGHKIFGPTGIGVLYGKESLLNETQPWQGGGNMIQDVTFEHTRYHNAPSRFEAGTGNIADAVGLGAALDYVSKIGIGLIGQYEHALLLYATKLLKDVPGLRLIGTAPDKASVLSFVLEGFRTEEVGAALNEEGIAVRSGHHCAQPILRRFGLEATVRPSLAFYNTCGEVDVLVRVLHRLRSARR
ncbi:family 2A encapsulin nanocompartment cargo protein cysteine desulfurase [Flavitalea flava]